MLGSMRGDLLHVKLLGYFLNFLEGEIKLLDGVSGHHRESNQTLARLHGGRHNGIHEHAFVLQDMTDLKAGHLVTGKNGNDRSLA